MFRKTHLFKILLILFTVLKNLLRPQRQSSVLAVEVNLSLKINIFSLDTPIKTKEVSMFKFAIEVCFENFFESINAIFLSLR